MNRLPLLLPDEGSPLVEPLALPLPPLPLALPLPLPLPEVLPKPEPLLSLPHPPVRARASVAAVSSAKNPARGFRIRTMS